MPGNKGVISVDIILSAVRYRNGPAASNAPGQEGGKWLNLTITALSERAAEASSGGLNCHIRISPGFRGYLHMYLSVPA